MLRYAHIDPHHDAHQMSPLDPTRSQSPSQSRFVSEAESVVQRSYSVEPRSRDTSGSQTSVGQTSLETHWAPVASREPRRARKPFKTRLLLSPALSARGAVKTGLRCSPHLFHCAMIRYLSKRRVPGKHGSCVVRGDIPSRCTRRAAT
jgi:hypothetical protein